MPQGAGEGEQEQSQQSKRSYRAQTGWPLVVPQGQEKMSKSDPNSAIFMEDEREDVERKIKKAFCPPQARDPLQGSVPDTRAVTCLAQAIYV